MLGHYQNSRRTYLNMANYKKQSLSDKLTVVYLAKPPNI
jgi:hypothetical protein